MLDHLIAAAMRRLVRGFRRGAFREVTIQGCNELAGMRRVVASLFVGAALCVAGPAQAVAPPDVTMCTNVDENIRLTGTAPAFPGAWWNPERYGTGWNLLYTGEDQLVVQWLTFNRNREPVWLQTDPAPIQNRTFQASLKSYRWIWSETGPGARDPNATTVGEVAITFNPEDPTKLAIEWQWDEVGPNASAECLVNFGRDPQPVALNTAASANSAYSGAWYEPALSGWGVVVNILPIVQGHNAISNYAESGAIAAYDDEGNPFWALLGAKNFNRQGDPSVMPPSDYYADPFPVLYVRPKNGYPEGVPVNDCNNEGCVDNSISVGDFNRAFISETQALGVLQVDAIVPGTATSITRYDRPGAGDTRDAVELVKLSDQMQVLVDRTHCILEAGQTRCPVTVDWAVDSAVLSIAPSVFRYDIVSGTRTRLAQGYSGQLVDELPPGRFQYELHAGSSPTIAFYRTPEVKVESLVQAQVWVDRTQCSAPVGGTCDITVGWSSNALATPGATLFRRDLNTDALSLLRTAINGVLTDALAPNVRVRYELHATSVSSSPLLAQSADVQTLAASASSVSVDRTQCTAPVGSSCSIQVTWSADAAAFPSATLFRRDVVFGTMTLLRTAVSGSLANALRAGERAVYELRATSDPASVKLAQSPEVVAVAPGPASVTVDRTSCIVPTGATTCPIQVTWSADTQAFPSAMLFRRTVSSSTLAPVQAGATGQVSDGLLSGERVVYELRATSDPASTLLASSPEVTARSATLSSVTVTPTLCTVPLNATTCSVQVTWATDTQLNPSANLFRRNAVSGEMTLVQSGASGSFADPLPAGTQWTFQLRVNAAPDSALLAESAQVVVSATIAPTTLSLDRTSCTIPEGQSTCVIRVTWSTDTNQNPQATVFRRNSVSSAMTPLRSATSGTFDDALVAGSRVTYELRRTVDPASERLATSGEVSATAATPSTVTATPNPCLVAPDASTCTVEVRWATDAALHPSATLFSIDVVTNFATTLQSLPAGTMPQSIAAGGTRRYELYSTATRTGTPLAQSANVTATISEGSGPAAVAPAPLSPVAPTADALGDAVGATPAEFRVDETGQANYRIPLYTARGRGGVQPALSLLYNSQTPDGPLGAGWMLEGPSTVSRCRTSTEVGDSGGPANTNQAEDGFAIWNQFCLDGQRLLLESGTHGVTGAVYRTEIDVGATIRIASSDGTANPLTWEIEGKDGLTHVLGGPDATLGTAKRLSWQTRTTTDRSTNAITYAYATSSVDAHRGQRLLSEVTYTGGRIAFTYEAAPQPDRRNVAGVALTTTQRLKSVESYAAPHAGGTPELVRSYTLAYEGFGQNAQRDRVRSVTECGRSASGAALTCRAPTTFDWAELCLMPFDDTATQSLSSACACQADENCDASAMPELQRNGGSGTQGVRHFIEFNSGKFGDIDGDGRQDVVWHEEEQNSTDELRVSFSSPRAGTGVDFETSQSIHTFGDDYSDNRSWFLFDFNADGRDDVLAAAPNALSGGGQWKVKLSQNLPNRSDAARRDADFAMPVDPVPAGGTAIPYSGSDASAMLADVNADGLPDLLTINKVPRGNTVDSVLEVRYLQSVASGSLTYTFGPARRVDVTFDRSLGCADLEFGHFRQESLDAFDIDGDGWSELALVANATTCQNGNGSPQVRGNRARQPAATIVSEPPNPAGLAALESRYWYVLRNEGPSGTAWHKFKAVRRYNAGYATNGNEEPKSTLQIVDINADGLADVVFMDKNRRWRYRLGDGTLTPESIESGDETQLSCILPLGGTQCATIEYPRHAFLSDFDGDGHLDFWYLWNTQNRSAFSVARWTGNGFEFNAQAGPTLTTRYTFRGEEWQYFPSDLDGDGLFDFFTVRGFRVGGTGVRDSGDWGVDRAVSHHTPRGLIHRIQNGLGAVTELDYAPMTFNDVYARETGTPTSENGMAYGRGAPVFNIAGPHWVVRSAQSSAPTLDDSEAKSQVQYRYGGLKVQTGGRGALGFRTVATYDWQSGVETRTEYRQAFPYIGRPTRTVSAIRSPWTAACAVGNYDTTTCMTYQPSESAVASVRLSDSRSEWQFRQRGNLQAESLPNAANKALQVVNTLQEQRYYDANYTDVISDSANPIEALTHWEITEFLKATTAGGVVCERGYDRWLNACKSKVTRVRRNVASSIIDQVVESEFNYGAENATGQRLGRLLRSSIKHSRPHEYDGTASGTTATTRVAAFDYDPVTFLLSAEHMQPEGSKTEQLHTYYQRDSYGNVLRKSVCNVAGQAACEATAANDATYQPNDPVQIARYARTVFDSLSRFEDETFSVHRRSGVVQEVGVGRVIRRNLLGAATASQNANGVQTDALFGAFGRPRFTKVSTGGYAQSLVRLCTPTTCPVGAVYRVEEAPAGSPQSWAYVDLLERPVLDLQAGFAVGQYIAVRTGYDHLGRVKSVSEPYFAQGPTGTPGAALQAVVFTETDYDAQGRVTNVTRPDGTAITTTYAGLVTTNTLPPNNLGGVAAQHQQTRIEYRNALGEVAKVEESLNQGITNAFTPTGEVRRVTLSGQTQTTSASYDNLGRKRSLIDPDVGQSRYVVNSLGEVVTELSPRGICTRLDYDMNGRLYRRRDYASGTYDDANGGCGSGNPDTESTWEYDTLEVGQLTEQRLGSHGTRYAYDAYHRPVSVTRTHDNGAARYVQRSTYDEYGRPFQRFFRAEAVQPFWGGAAVSLPETGELFEYNAQGYGYLTRNAFPGRTGRVYHEVEAMTSRGQVEREVRKAGVAVATERGYNLATGRLLSIETAGGALQDLSYGYDDVGNVVRRVDNSFVAPVAESFAYDTLQRLYRVEREVNGVLNTDVTSYDAEGKGAGNIASKAGLGSYVYGSRPSYCTEAGEVTPGPHAVSQAGGQSYCYDARGNLVRDSRGRRISYTTFDLPSRMIHAGTDRKVEFEYGAGRERVRRRDYASALGVTPRSITDYAGEAEIYRSAEGIEIKRHLGSIIVTQRLDSAGSLGLSRDYVFADTLGSTHVVTDSFGVIKSPNGQQGFDAWGARRSTDAAQVLSEGVLAQFDTRSSTRHGFTGHEQVDELGLIHMNGRIYDPILGRFMQADVLVQDSLNALSWNRFAYVFNNPLGYTDPSGHLSKGWRAAIAIVITIYTAGTASGATWGWYAGAEVTAGQAFAWTVAGGAAAGAVQSGNLRGAVTGALSSAMFFGIGANMSPGPAKVAAHGMAGGVMAELQGGSFGHGFASAALTQAMSPAIDQIATLPGRIAFAAVLGGTTSVIGGGKFANGALTGAFSRAFNDEHEQESYEEPSCDDYCELGRIRSQQMETLDEAGEALSTIGDVVEMAAPVPGLPLLKAGGLTVKAGIWSTKKGASAVQNAFGHWVKHRHEFPELANAKQYVEYANAFVRTPPPGTASFLRGGDTLMYHAKSNIFAVSSAQGTVRTMFRPPDGAAYWLRQTSP